MSNFDDHLSEGEESTWHAPRWRDGMPNCTRPCHREMGVQEEKEFYRSPKSPRHNRDRWMLQLLDDVTYENLTETMKNSIKAAKIRTEDRIRWHRRRANEEWQRSTTTIYSASSAPPSGFQLSGAYAPPAAQIAGFASQQATQSTGRPSFPSSEGSSMRAPPIPALGYQPRPESTPFSAPGVKPLAATSSTKPFRKIAPAPPFRPIAPAPPFKPIASDPPSRPTTPALSFSTETEPLASMRDPSTGAPALTPVGYPHQRAYALAVIQGLAQDPSSQANFEVLLSHGKGKAADTRSEVEQIKRRVELIESRINADSTSPYAFPERPDEIDIEKMAEEIGLVWDLADLRRRLWLAYENYIEGHSIYLAARRPPSLEPTDATASTLPSDFSGLSVSAGPPQPALRRLAPRPEPATTETVGATAARRQRSESEEPGPAKAPKTHKSGKGSRGKRGKR